MKPTTLEEAIDILEKGLADDERVMIAATTPATHHHTVGRWIRNNWKLWDPASPLSLHFLDRYDLTHADDMSGMILDGLFARIKNEAFDPDQEAQTYHDFWAREATKTITWP